MNRRKLAQQMRADFNYQKTTIAIRGKNRKKSNAYEKAPCLDFFAGSGLATEGLKEFFSAVWANDICQKKAAVYRANHADVPFHLGTIEHVDGSSLPGAVLSWGSFPCQDLSLAGNMGGLSQARSGLVWQWLRVNDELRIKPRILVAENVVGLLSAEKGKHYRLLHNALVDRGYAVGAIVLDASYWVPQSRKRVFVIGVDASVPIDGLVRRDPTWCHPRCAITASRGLDGWVWWNLPEPQSVAPELESIVDFNAPCDDSLRRDRLLSLIPDAHRDRMRCEAKRGRRVFPGYKRVRNGVQVLELRFDGLAGCLRTPQGGSSRQHLVIVDRSTVQTRLLTVSEAAALMGAGGTYAIPGNYNDGYRAMGDAVAVPAVKYLAEELLYPLTCIIRGEDN